MTRWNLLLCASLIMSALAQDRIVPHDVSADRHVTFRLNAPKANQVMLNFAAWNTKPQPMTKNEKGVWSITVGPLEPEIYSYTFAVDGVRNFLYGGVALAGANGPKPPASERNQLWKHRLLTRPDVESSGEVLIVSAVVCNPG